MITSDYDVIDYEAGADNDLRGQECASCFRLLKWNFFDKNSSYKTGHDPQCSLCKKAPRLSLSEHTSRLKEMNLCSEGTKRQRHPDQEDFKGNRSGRMMDCLWFLMKLRSIYPSLYVSQGGVIGDLALYATSGLGRPEWGGNTFKYIGYVTLGTMPEYSKYEFNDRDVVIKATEIGWRSVLLRFVQNGLITDSQCQFEFGSPSGGETSTWYKNLYRFRNAKAT
jgi:hypothetical protein